MTQEPKGSKPGPIERTHTQLSRVNTIPTVEFAIPPSEPVERVYSKECHPRQTQCSEPHGKSESELGRGHGNYHGDEESVVTYHDQDGNEIDYPEGGVKGWLCVLGSFAGTTCCFGMMNTVGVFQSYVSEHQLKGYNESTIGWIFSMYVFLSFFCGIQIGPIFDSRGPKMLILAGGVCMSASMLLLGLCSQYWHFLLVFGVLGGLGTSLIFTPAFSAVGHFFFVKRGNATGIAAAGGSLGGIIFPLMLQRLFTQVGFAWATRIVGFIFIFLCAVAQLLIRSRLPSRPGQSVMPDFRIFKEPAFALATAGTYFMEWGLFVPVAYLPSFAISTGAITPAFAYQLVAIMNAGSCIGRWAPGYISDKLGRFNSMIATLAICTAVTVTLWLPASILEPRTATEATTIKALTIVYTLIFGFASGSNISLVPVCVGQLCDTNEYGRYYATCYTLVSFGTLTGIPIAGAILQATGGRFWGVVVWTGCSYVLSLACYLWARACKVGWKLGEKY